jgi:hypothetical protein
VPKSGIVVRDADLGVVATPAGKYWFYDEMFPVDKNGRQVPSFSVQEVSKFFFGRNPDWLRWRYRSDERTLKSGEVRGEHAHGFFVLDGEPLEPKRTKTGYRYYSLADVERMAHALAQNGALDGMQLANIIALVRACAAIHHVKNIKVEEPHE